MTTEAKCPQCGVAGEHDIIECLKNQITAANADLAAAKAENKRLEADRWTIVCGFCGEEMKAKSHEDRLAKIAKHILTCEKHPLFKLAAERDDLLNESDTLQCDVASALGWCQDELHGMPFDQAVRGLRMAHAIERKQAAELQAVVDKLPKDAEGNPVAPWMCLWTCVGGAIAEVEVRAVYNDTLGIIHVGWPGKGRDEEWDEYASDCCSTKESALRHTPEESNAE